VGRLGERALVLARRLTVEPPAVGRFSGEVVFLAAAVVSQWIAVVLLATQAAHNGWFYYQGGDETFFYTVAWVLGHGHLPFAGVGYAWSLVEAPITLITGPSVLVGLPAIVAVQVLVLLPLGLVTLYGTAKRLLGAFVARVAVVAWILAPYGVIPLFVHRYHPKWTDLTLPQLLGLSGMGDFVSMTLLLCAAYLLFRHLDEGAWELAALAGLVTGFAIGVKPSNSLFLGGAAVGLLLARRFPGLLAFGLALLPAALTLVIWKQRGLGSQPLFSYGATQLAAGLDGAAVVAATGIHKYINLDWNHLGQNFDGFREFFWSRRLVEWLPVAGAIGALRRSPAKAGLLAAWLGAYVIVKGANEVSSVQSASFWRLLSPAWPAYFLLGLSIVALVPTLGGRLPPVAANPPPPSRYRPQLAAAAALLALVPLVVVAALPRDRVPRGLKDEDRNLYIPVDRSLHLTASRSSRGVTLTWTTPASGSTRTTYLVLRAPLHGLFFAGLECDPRPGAVPLCIVRMAELAFTPTTSFVDRPPPGRWVYRVAQAANYVRGEQAGDPLLYSPPVTVTVPAA
jgi:hypothetical protein